jgi:hypothetical protein
MNQTTTLPLPERLKNGAKKLGQLWKIPEERCVSGWSLDPCTCQPTKKFCRAKDLWLTLAIEAGRDLDYDPFGLALAMTASEWDETGLLLRMSHPEIGEVLVGSGPKKMTMMQDLLSLMSTPDSLKDILMVMKTFENSRVFGVEEAAVAPAPVEAAAPLAATVEANPDEAFE